MLKFFRIIRKKFLDEGNLKRYLVYAFGEILLVMIGILLALQVSNSNQTRRERKLKTNYVNALIEDIENDLEVLEYFNKLNNSYDSLGEYLLGFLEGELVEIDSQKIYSALVHANWKPSYYPISSTYNDLTFSGNLVLFEDLKFKNLLDQYYQINDWVEKYDNRITKTMWYCALPQSRNQE